MKENYSDTKIEDIKSKHFLHVNFGRDNRNKKKDNYNRKGKTQKT